MKTLSKIIIKVGTSTLTQGTQKLSRRYMLELVQQMVHLRSQGLQLILVTSGAVTTGKELLNSQGGSLPSKQAFASIGQVKLMQVWSELFSLFDIQVGQLLLSKDDFSPSKEHLTRDTVDCLLRHQIIPIINENDTVAEEGICIGNNDSLAALVGNLTGADAVILLTDQEGLYTADPRYDLNAKLISVVRHIDQKICAYAKGAATVVGTGGMVTKIEAAQIAAGSGIQTIIASSSRPNVLIDLVKGKRIGTLFLAGGPIQTKRKEGKTQ